MEEKILYRQVKSVKIGQIERFKIHYTPDKSTILPPSIWVKIKNVELIALRAAYLAGPYVLYVDCKLEDYDHNEKCFITADQPVFESQLLPGQSFYAELSCHTIKDSYCWIVDVISQIIFNNTITVDFEMSVGTSKSILHESSFPEKDIVNADNFGLFAPSTMLEVTNQDTLDLWNLPIPDPTKPIHLVIVSHGLHSNVSADLLYLKEQIDRVGDNIVVKGFFGNVGKTERGIKYLGSRVAEYVVDLVANNEMYSNGKVDRISFVGHSLGGLVQTFAIAYLHSNFPWFFTKIKPINFITLSTPLLGVANENPVYVKLALLAGIVGKTGQDLGLKYVENDSKPLLLLLPTGPTHQALKKFARRTLYANAMNDGIAPLRTSSLLYLDYKGLSQIINSPDTKTINSGKIPKQTSFGDNCRESIAGFSPVQAMLSYFLPQQQGNSKYHRFQTGIHEGEPSPEENDDESKGNFPSTSFLESATTAILPPLPTLKYITDPESRDNVILHDKVYYDEDLPPGTETTTTPTRVGENIYPSRITENLYPSNIKQRILNTLDYEVEHLEEQIAREYHKNMSWRKVIVKLKPDAHNNIIVRRRFANAYGWPVMEHLVENHFRDSSESPEENTTAKAIGSTDSLDREADLSSIIGRDLITEQNNEIDKQTLGSESVEHYWVNSKDNAESIFAVGPTGLLCDITEMMGNLRDHWNNYSLKRGSEFEETTEISVSQEFESSNGDLGLAKRIMGGFL